MLCCTRNLRGCCCFEDSAKKQGKISSGPENPVIHMITGNSYRGILSLLGNLLAKCVGYSF